MTIDAKKIKSLTRKIRIEMASIEDKSLRNFAWELLQDKDDDGQSRGSLPYTLKAIDAMQAAYRANRESIKIVHHLAISYHAYAWDLEIKNDPQAAKYWRLALEFWRKIISSGQFWREMCVKMLKYDSEISEAKAQKHIDAIRKDLYENLLDIHVAFISHYHECGCMDRATVHVDIVNTARIPPAVSLRLVKQVYEEMTRSMPESLNAKDYQSALATVQNFLDLFPEHIKGLISYMEIGKNWLDSCSYVDDWDEIINISTRIKPFTMRLISHDEYDFSPTARMELADMVKEIFYHCHDRTSSLLPNDNKDITVKNRDIAIDVFQFAIDFGRITYSSAPTGHEIKKLLPAFLRNYTFCIDLKMTEIFESKPDLNDDIVRETLIDLVEIGIRYLEESLSYVDNDKASEELKQYNSLLITLQQ
jgi:hypothetical protein